MSLGWFDDLADANDYYKVERFVKDLWNDLSNGDRNAVIINAYNRLYYDTNYNLPDYATATAAELVILKKVNGEMAYYLLMHLEAEDRRMGYQAQGVTDAGIVEEKYKKGGAAIPDNIKAMIKPWLALKTYGAIVELARDEEKSVDEKASKF